MEAMKARTLLVAVPGYDSASLLISDDAGFDAARLMCFVPL